MNIRLLPLLGISASALLVLKLAGLALGPDTGRVPINGAQAQESMEEGAADASSPPPPPPPELPAGAPPPPPGSSSEPSALPNNLEIGGSAAERAVLESLGRRRESLQQQEGQLDLREKLLRATEERIQKQVEELKKLEARIDEAVEAKKKQEENEIAGLVTMYENMKPKEAARIFDRLSLPILLKVVRQMNPRKMAAILAKMSPEAAERLTVAIATNGTTAAASPAPTAQPARAPAASQEMLPKIPSN